MERETPYAATSNHFNPLLDYNNHNESENMKQQQATAMIAIDTSSEEEFWCYNWENSQYDETESYTASLHHFSIVEEQEENECSQPEIANK